jgi:predicted DNA-binding ribbon-helix-helix protein
MTTMWSAVTQLSDAQLLDEVKIIAKRERASTAALIAALAEMDARRLYLGEGFSSLFIYCTQALHLSEHAAYGRIEAARAARRFPLVFDLLSGGAITLTTITLLAPHLTEANHSAVLESARHKSKRDVEFIVASLRPRPPVPTTIRKLPAPRTPMASQPTLDAVNAENGALRRAYVAPRRPALLTPLTTETFKIQLTVSRDVHDKLRRVQDLLRHVVPSGDPAVIFERAVTLLLNRLEKTRSATPSPRKARHTAARSRHVPSDVKRRVWKRDEGRCAFVGTHGRCTARGLLEYHHVVPYAAGGETTVENLELRCRAHNQYEADLFLGPMMVREERATWPVPARSGPSC